MDREYSSTGFITCHSQNFDRNASEPEDGAFGEYSVVKEGITMKIPENLNDEEASCIGLGLVTAVSLNKSLIK